MNTRPEDESADPVGDGHSDAEFASRVVIQPGRPNPEPDGPPPVMPDVPADAGADDDEDSERHPARRPPGPAL